MKTLVYPILFITLLFLIVGFFSQVKAQKLNNLKIDRNDESYFELDSVLKFKITILDRTVKDLLDTVCQNLGDGTYNCGNEQDNDFQLAGLCFIPIWTDLTDSFPNLKGDHIFQTVGIRIAVVLWKPSSNNGPDEVILAGFGNNSKSIENALLPIEGTEYHENLGHYTIEEKFQPHSTFRTSSLFSKQELLRIKDTREFDFAFLSYEDYLYLATSPDFYGEKGRLEEEHGIIIERSLSGLDVSLNDPDTFELINFRSLSIRPNPLPELRTVTTRVAIAYEQGKHCPPYWWLNDLVETFEQTVIKEMEDRKEKPEVRPSFGISFHLGYNSPLGTFNQLYNGGLLYELDIEYLFNNQLSLEALVGRYQFSDNFKIYGLSLQLKRYLLFPLLSTQSIATSIYGSIGIGAYDLPTSTEVGIIGGLGLSSRIVPKLHIETGFQYQNVSLISNSSSQVQFWVWKIGVKYYL